MEPPGSGDDVSDEEAADLFDTENVVVCQYEKISRTRNKWKLSLKVGNYRFCLNLREALKKITTFFVTNVKPPPLKKISKSALNG